MYRVSAMAWRVCVWHNISGGNLVWRHHVKHQSENNINKRRMAYGIAWWREAA